MRTKAFDLQKYINKLKVAKAPVYIIGQENGLALKNIKHPAVSDVQPVPKVLQISEFYNNMKEDHSYFSEDYKSHLYTLKTIDSDWKETKSMESRIALSKSAINQWKTFIESVSLPEEEYKVREGTLIKLEDIWMRFKKRNKNTITAEEILPFHNEFVTHYKFDIPIHQKNLAMMLHPHWGYLCKYTEHDFNFNHIVDFYYDEFVSSYLRNLGMDILANRVSAFNYWKLVDDELKGYLTFKDFLYLIQSVAFETENLTNVNAFKKEFSHTLSNLPNELLEQEKTDILRFRLFESLFLERCAI